MQALAVQMKIHTNRPQLKVNDEFKEICKKILDENKSFSEWEKIESDDMFQSIHFCGGFDGIEQEFSFSYYDPNDKEWWLQLPLEEVQKVYNGELLYLELIEPC